MKKISFSKQLKMSFGDEWIYAIFNIVRLAGDRGYDITDYQSFLEQEHNYRSYLGQIKATETATEDIRQLTAQLMAGFGFFDNNIVFLSPNQQSFLLVRLVFTAGGLKFESKEASEEINKAYQKLPTEYRSKEHDIVLVINMAPKKIKHQTMINLKNVRVFNVRELMLNPTRHKLYDPHIKIEKSSPEYQQLLYKAQGEINNLAKMIQGIYRMDIICRYFGFESGDVIRISNRNNIYWNAIVNDLTTYRIVKNLTFKPV